MKRCIAILIALQIGFIPFCGVFAMESAQGSSIPDGCEIMQKEAALNLMHAIPHLACCNAKTTQETSAQASFSFDATPPAIQTHVSSDRYFGISSNLDASIHSNFKHPPDDFERLSQSKRE